MIIILSVYTFGGWNDTNGARFVMILFAIMILILGGIAMYFQTKYLDAKRGN